MKSKGHFAQLEQFLQKAFTKHESNACTQSEEKILDFFLVFWGSFQYHSSYTGVSFGIHIAILGSLCISETLRKQLGLSLENGRSSGSGICRQQEMIRKQIAIASCCFRGLPKTCMKSVHVAKR